MEQLGFKLNFRLVPADTFTKFCGVPAQKVAICPNVGWFRDFADPQSMLDATFNATSSRRATSTGRSSTSRRPTTR
jgi:peptide/nickel transport system substrate-binding protein